MVVQRDAPSEMSASRDDGHEMCIRDRSLVKNINLLLVTTIFYFLKVNIDLL